MVLKSHPKIYETIGSNYCQARIPDARIARRIHRALGDAVTVCNVGAGTGSYEPDDREVVAVEPSQKMIDQRPPGSRVIQAAAEAIPLEDNSFDVSMAVLTIHHWDDPAKGLSEMRRISNRQVVMAFDPDWIDSLWLVRDYLPEIVDLENDRRVPIQSIMSALKTDHVQPLLVPWDCTDGFQAAYWRRPEKYLAPMIRNSISSLAQLPTSVVLRAVDQLEHDLQTGAWHQRNAHLLEKSEMDFGYRLIVGGG